MTSILNNVKVFALFYIYLFTNLVNTKETESNKCIRSGTSYNGEMVCQGALIVQELFYDLNQSVWTIEKYIPQEPNFEFNYYSSDSVYIHGGSTLRITPVSIDFNEDVKGTLNLTKGCTRSDPNECFYEHMGAQLLPSVKSGKITSKFTFKYGHVLIEAKLPCGDWIVPEISLTPTNHHLTPNNSKIIIAYSRGNANLRSVNSKDIGGTLLFAGFYSNVSEPIVPGGNANLGYKRNVESFCRKKHYFKLEWKPDSILAFVDDESVPFAHIDMRGQTEDAEYYISLGVSVGGINDFPDNYVYSNDYKKPWKNKDVLQKKSFYTSRNTWRSTWSQKNSLEVKMVRVYAL